MSKTPDEMKTAFDMHWKMMLEVGELMNQIKAENIVLRARISFLEDHLFLDAADKLKAMDAVRASRLSSTLRAAHERSEESLPSTDHPCSESRRTA